MRRLTTAAAFVGLSAVIALLLDRFVRRPDEWQPPPGTSDAASPATEPATPVTTEPADSPEPETEAAGARRSAVATNEVIIDLTDSAMAAMRADDEDSPAQN